MKSVFSALILALILAACTLDTFSIYHRFEFDLRRDDQHALILDYKYLDGDKLLESGNEAYVTDGSGFKVCNSGIYAPKGTSLYVKWRDETNGTIYEDNVNMKKTLPVNMVEKTIYLMIRGPQLYIYVVPKDEPDNRRPANAPPIGPSGLGFLNTVQVYPPPSLK